MRHDLLNVRVGALNLTIVGRLPELPPHVLIRPDAAVRVRVPEGYTFALRVYDRSAKSLVALSEGIRCEPVLFEFGEYDLYLEARAGRVEARHPSLLEHVRDFNAAQGHTITHYRITLANDVGWLRLWLIASPGETPIVLEAEVFPRKLDYHTDYRALTASLSETAHNLVFDVLSKTSVAAGLVATTQQTTTEWYQILDAVVGDLLETIDAIKRDPRRRLEPTEVLVRAERARRIAPRDLQRLDRSGRTERSSGSAALWRESSRLPERRTVGSYDTHENRYLRWVLEQILARLTQLRATLRDTGSSAEDGPVWQAFRRRWLAEADGLMPRIQSRLRLEFLRDVGTLQQASQTVALESDPLYARAFSLGQTLLRGLHMGAAEFVQIGAKPIWLLYEYWCYLTIVDLLKRDSDLIQCSFVSVDFQGSRVVLSKGVEAATEFRHRRSTKVLRVVYNRLYPTPTVRQRPDTAVHIEGQNQMYVFDAKYRIQFDADYVATYGGVGPHVEDINTMHRYRDAIVNRALGSYARPVHGAYVLFPFADAQTYRTHAFFQSIAEVGIGGYPFLPRCTDLVEEKLRAIVESICG